MQFTANTIMLTSLMLLGAVNAHGQGFDNYSTRGIN